MSRILVLLPVAFWFVWSDGRTFGGTTDWGSVTLYLCGLPVLVLLYAYTALRAARGTGYGRQARIYSLAKSLTPIALLAWHGVGLFVLGWGDAVAAVLRGETLRDLALPGAVLATLPVYAAWALVPLAEYPGVVRRREARLLTDLEDGRRVFMPPPLRRYWLFTLRQRMLFALLPLLALMAIRDAATLALAAFDVPVTANVSALLLLGSAVFVVAVSPELLRRILPTRPLRDGPLRDNLEVLCGRVGMGVRDILVWDTDRSMVNAAVVGFLPRLRYVLLSDLMLETMTLTQIEAVFAHELGHVRHRHIQWYVLFLAGITLFFGGPVDAAWRWLGIESLLPAMSENTAVYAASAAVLALILLAFGLLSRCFERQADVFAARTMQATLTPGDTRRPTRVAVGPEGAAAFCSSLAQVAQLNFLPLDRPRRRPTLRTIFAWTIEQFRDFLHGTIRGRMDYLLRLAARPAATRRFDRLIVAVKLAVLVMTLGSGWFVWRHGG